ncbi:MAG: hypothetical protein IIA91_09970 [Chloroflexi bacterium]|nr:hypothetical protein [Chloroflexota bacterium]
MQKDQGGDLATDSSEHGPRLRPAEVLEYQAPTDEQGNYVSRKRPRLAILLNGITLLSGIISLRFLRDR